MRIDTARNQIETTRGLLSGVLVELDDLHVLAYNREVAADELKVAGGSIEWYLDTHGNTKVRDAFRTFSDQATRTSADLEDTAHALLRHLTDSHKGVRTGPRTTTAMEHALLLEAKARRARRGEYQPFTRVSQPARDDALTAAMQENEQLSRANHQLNKTLAEAQRTIDQLREQRRRTA